MAEKETSDSMDSSSRISSQTPLEDAHEPERPTWGSKFEFFLTMVGFAIGLGNVWRFPYLCYKDGGGAFVLPFTICLFVIGVPMFLLELGLGQFSSRGPSVCWQFSPVWKGLGLASVLVAFYFLYYNVIVAWCFYYLFASMTSPLPWVDCDNCWNTLGCYVPGDNISGISNGTHLNGYKMYTAAEEYYYFNVLHISDGMENMGSVVWQLAALLFLCWTLVFLILIKGIKTLGKAMYFISLFPYVILTIMLIFGAMLPGAGKGMLYLITPVWEKLLDGQVWADAASQVFYACGFCFGGIVGMSSFNQFNYNIKRDAYLVPIVVLFTSIYAALVVFCVLGYLAEMKGVEIDEVVQQGPGLVFVAYPEGLATMPGSTLWSILFFLMMCTLGMSSTLSLSESACTSIIDEFPALSRGVRPIILRACYCTLTFLCGLPMVTEGGFYLFTLMDTYTAGYPLLVIGIGELLVVSWVYGHARFRDDIAMMIGRRINIVWVIMWGFIVPALIFVVLVIRAVNESALTVGDYVYPDSAMTLAALIVAGPLVLIFGWWLVYFCYKGGWNVTRTVSKPTDKWHPALRENRLGRYAVKPDDQTKTETNEMQNGIVQKTNGYANYGMSNVDTVL